VPRARPVLAATLAAATLATAGSLYFSLGLGLTPCRLCWYQRILMYPLVVVLGVALLDDDPSAWRTVLPLSTLGLAVAAYHVLLQVGAVGSGTGTCGVGGGCSSVVYPMLGGLLTIPRLSLVGFLLVTAGGVALTRLDRR
jgi:disulfide bond formation protein DsbB